MNFFLFLDYDGTLSPIVRRPEKAKLTSGQRMLLKNLSSRKNVFLSIVSGRTLKDVKSRVKLPNLLYVGSHGLEICGKGINWKHPQIKMGHKLHKMMLEILRQRLKPIKGVIIEDKEPICAVHYRLVKNSDLPKLNKLIAQAVKPHQNKIKIKNGKKVVEVWQKINWDKGQAVLKVLKMFSGRHDLPMHIGDDKTDEDVFKVLRNIGITIKVGLKGSTQARSRLKNVGSVYNFLHFFSDMLKFKTS
jgi:trehalose 6-phosphate phosphatase